ncbi:SpoIIE family protein phosphatase [Streptomyces nojiriensis]|uniref:SpoIIE family protein phosphatase n=1 Tax=Streptomyces nojiriensis TaxID=66374 RepID=UPI001FCAEDBC|nr:SpoIIE family protein phosphatase [Streptomyces nojiriensis]
MGDVRGKGLPAVRTVAALLGSFRDAAYEAHDLPAVAARLERGLVREPRRPGTPNCSRPPCSSSTTAWRTR